MRTGAPVGITAADVLLALAAGIEEPVIGVATGNTPLALYQELSRRREAGESTLVPATRLVALDEYIGLPSDSEHSFGAYINRNIATPLGIGDSNLMLFPPDATDLESVCSRFEASIRELGGVDVQILGIGRNGHIGFNEPPARFRSRTHVEQLTDETMRANASSFPDGVVPRLAVTQGIATILDARAIIVLAEGPHKAQALADAVAGPVSGACPASILRSHANVIVVADDAALSLVPENKSSPGLESIVDIAAVSRG